MTDTPAPPGASSLLPSGEIPVATMLDGSTVALPAGTPDQPPLQVLRQQSMGELQRLRGSEEFKRLLLAGDSNALATVQRLERIIKTPTGTIYGGQQTPEQIDQHQQAWRDFSDIGVAFGADVERQFRNNEPITESDFRNAQAKLAELKSDKEFVRRYFDGGRKERSIMQLLHRMLASKVTPDKK